MDEVNFYSGLFQFFTLVGEVRWPSYECRTDAASKKVIAFFLLKEKTIVNVILFQSPLYLV